MEKVLENREEWQKKTNNKQTNKKKQQKNLIIPNKKPDPMFTTMFSVFAVMKRVSCCWTYNCFQINDLHNYALGKLKTSNTDNSHFNFHRCFTIYFSNNRGGWLCMSVCICICVCVCVCVYKCVCVCVCVCEGVFVHV